MTGSSRDLLTEMASIAAAKTGYPVERIVGEITQTGQFWSARPDLGEDTAAGCAYSVVQWMDFVITCDGESVLLPVAIREIVSVKNADPSEVTDKLRWWSDVYRVIDRYSVSLQSKICEIALDGNNGTEIEKILVDEGLIDEDDLP